jgi:hypothetical protein
METLGESRQWVATKTAQNDATRKAVASASDIGDHGEGDGGHDEEEVGAPASNPSSYIAAMPRKRGRLIG